jgi:hypothetical protein
LTASENQFEAAADEQYPEQCDCAQYIENDLHLLLSLSSYSGPDGERLLANDLGALHWTLSAQSNRGRAEPRRAALG